MELLAPSHWRCVDFISDLHLQDADRATFKAWSDYLQSTSAEAVFILGDLFEVWVGDDAMDTPGFEAECVSVLRRASRRLEVFIMPGNRDFLMGSALMQACGARLLHDPAVLTFQAQRWLLSHADALCLDDHEYQAFRRQVRAKGWQSAFLLKPLPERQAIARGIRHASETRKKSPVDYADVDRNEALRLLQSHNSAHLIHGHTHRPGQHRLDEEHTRTVLSDWDMRATPPRAEVLRLEQVNAQTCLRRIPAHLIAGARG